jgi:hypothetical protein
VCVQPVAQRIQLIKKFHVNSNIFIMRSTPSVKKYMVLCLCDLSSTSLLKAHDAPD